MGNLPAAVRPLLLPCSFFSQSAAADGGGWAFSQEGGKKKERKKKNWKSLQLSQLLILLFGRKMQINSFRQFFTSQIKNRKLSEWVSERVRGSGELRNRSDWSWLVVWQRAGRKWNVANFLAASHRLGGKKNNNKKKKQTKTQPQHSKCRSEKRGVFCTYRMSGSSGGCFWFFPRRCSLAAASLRDAGCCKVVGLCGLFFGGGVLSFFGGYPVERFDRRCQMKNSQEMKTSALLTGWWQKQQLCVLAVVNTHTHAVMSATWFLLNSYQQSHFCYEGSSLISFYYYLFIFWWLEPSRVSEKRNVTMRLGAPGVWRDSSFDWCPPALSFHRSPWKAPIETFLKGENRVLRY